MPLEEWQDKLIVSLRSAKKVYDWYVRDDGAIRTKTPPVKCVLSAVAYSPFTLGQWEEAGSEIGLTVDQSIMVWMTADRHLNFPDFESEFRERMLEALGLKEGAAGMAEEAA